jgi:hypothetical protein
MQNFSAKRNIIKIERKDGGTRGSKIGVSESAPYYLSVICPLISVIVNLCEKEEGWKVADRPLRHEYVISFSKMPSTILHKPNRFRSMWTLWHILMSSYLIFSGSNFYSIMKINTRNSISTGWKMTVYYGFMIQSE